MKIKAVIMSCDKPTYQLRLRAAQQTFLRNIPENIHVSVFNSSLLGLDDYEQSPARLRFICKQFVGTDYDYLLRLDDDVLVSWKNIKYPPVGSHYHGHQVPRPSKGQQVPYIAGAVMWLSQEAASILADELPDTGYDDSIAGDILYEYGINPTFDIYHYIVRRVNLAEILPLDVLKFKERGFALEVGTPNNFFKLWDDYLHIGDTPIHTAAYSDAKNPRVFGPADYVEGQKKQGVFKQSPVVARPQNFPMRNYNPKLKGK